MLINPISNSSPFQFNPSTFQVQVQIKPPNRPNFHFWPISLKSSHIFNISRLSKIQIQNPSAPFNPDRKIEQNTRKPIFGPKTETRPKMMARESFQRFPRLTFSSRYLINPGIISNFRIIMIIIQIIIKSILFKIQIELKLSTRNATNLAISAP